MRMLVSMLMLISMGMPTLISMEMPMSMLMSIPMGMSMSMQMPPGRQTFLLKVRVGECQEVLTTTRLR
jgi:hypothetical protein